MLNESLDHFKFDSIRFQQALNIFFYTFNNVERPVQTSAPDIWFNEVLNAC